MKFIKRMEKFFLRTFFSDNKLYIIDQQHIHTAVFFPEIRQAVENKADVIKGYVVGQEGLKEFEVTLGELTDDEREIILKGCLINYNRK